MNPIICCLRIFILCIPLGLSGLVVIAQQSNEVIDYSTHITVKKNRLITRHSLLIQINDKQSDWISDIQIPYYNRRRIKITEASVVSLNGKVLRKLSSKEITTKNQFSYGSLFEDRFVKEFKLKWNEYPYRVRYSYETVESGFFYITKWSPFFRNVPVRKASLTVDLPSDYKVNMDYSKDFRYHSSQKEKNIIHTWEIDHFPRLREETYAPPFYELLPIVSIVPGYFNYGFPGSHKSWQTFGTWNYGLNQGMDVLPFHEKTKVAQLIENQADQREIIKTLYHYMQDNTRYVNVSIDIGGLKPYPASYVVNNKYGDCKALTVYMKALLKEAGIESIYALINSGRDHVEINPEFPSQQFNHVILCVPLGNDTIWLENTSKDFPLNYLSTFNQDRFSLLVDSKNSRLVKTPAMGTDDLLESRVYHFHITGNGNGSLQLYKDLRGEMFEFYRYIQRNLNNRDQKSSIENKAGIRNALLNNWSFDYSDRSDKNIKVKLEYELQQPFRRIAGNIVLSPVSVLDDKLEPPEKRQYPVRIDYPVNRQDTIIHHHPFNSNYETRLPEERIIDSQFGRYTVNYSEEEERIITIRSFQLFSGNYSLEEYPEFYNFIDMIKKSLENSHIILSPKK